VSRGQAPRLIDLVVEVTSLYVALVSEEQVAAQRVQALALVQLTPVLAMAWSMNPSSMVAPFKNSIE
jgi:hypothetical protein